MKREVPQGPTARTGISCELNLKNAQHGTSIPGGSQRKVESSISSLGLQTGDGSGRRSRKPYVRPWTLAGASAVPRAAQQAPCRAGSQELLQRAGSCEASSGKPPFDLPSSRGVPLPASQNACSGRDRRGHGAQPHWVDGSSRALGGADAGQGHTGSWEERGQLGTSVGAPVLTQGCLHSSVLLVLPLALREAGRQGLLPPISLLWGVHFLSELSKFKGVWNGGGGARTAQGREWVFKSQRLLYLSRF